MASTELMAGVAKPQEELHCLKWSRTTALLVHGASASVQGLLMVIEAYLEAILTVQSLQLYRYQLKWHLPSLTPCKTEMQRSVHAQCSVIHRLDACAK